MLWRTLAASVCLLLSAPAASLAQSPPQLSPDLPSTARDDFFETRTYDLSPAGQAGAATLTVFPPQNGHASRAAVVVAPGGAYIGLAANLEGRQVADWFAARGVTAFVLRYRLGGAAPLPIPIEDGERAVRFVRANAAALGVDADRIGMIGFSAGGHLAAMTTARSDDGAPTSSDPVERVSSRPDFLVLGYPWLEATTVDAAGHSEYCRFAGFARWSCRPEDYAAVTPLPALTTKAPATFIYHTTDDGLVPVMGSVRLYTALHEAGVDVEMHLFAHGAHGTGLGAGDPALQLWPQALDAWLRARGYLDKPPAGR
jgi:acetyl esterase/lipase